MSYRPPPYTCWAPGGDWCRGHIILAANVDTIPSPPPRHQADVMMDGWWGEHEWTLYPQQYRREFPYLPWLRLPSKDATDILTKPLHKRMWQVHPTKTNIHSVDPGEFRKFKGKLEDVQTTVLGPLRVIDNDTHFRHVRPPTLAYRQAVEALDRLEMEFGAWRDFVEVVRGLQRNLRELLAFADWWQDVQQGSSFQPPFPVPTRGAIFDDEDLYTKHSRRSIASYLIVPSDLFIPDPDKQVTLSPRNLSRMDPISAQPLLHSLYLWYYPPHVRDVYTDFETAARGYGDRLDSFKPTNGLKRKLDKSKNRRADEDGRRAKMAKSIEAKYPGPSNNPELRRLVDARTPPPWYPDQQDIWKQAMAHVPYVVLKQTDSPRRFALPPIHLFWGASEQNQRTYYYHFLVLRHEFSYRAEQSGLPCLTTEEWRSVLGNTYWKSMWPRTNHGDSNSSNFDPERFWIHGGPLFFGNELSAEVASGREVTTLMTCRCEVKIDSADDDNIRQTVLYHLNLEHASAEIKDMYRIQFPQDFQRRIQDRLTHILSMTDMWGPCRNGGVNSDFFVDKKAWTVWLRAAREVIMDWEGFDEWDWDGLTNVRTIGIDNMDPSIFFKMSLRILTFFIHTFVTRLGYYPSPMLLPPFLASHHCIIHPRKFATGLLLS